MSRMRVAVYGCIKCNVVSTLTDVKMLYNEPVDVLSDRINFFLIIYLHANICQQVQDIEFMQIEMQVIEGLKVGNDCLKSMHEVDVLLCLLFFFTLTFCV